MELTQYAPQEVINLMSKFTRLCFENRIINKILRNVMITQHQNIRLRGFKPSILYSKFTTIDNNNDIQIKYSAKSENNQCALMEQILAHTYIMSSTEKLYRQSHELKWSVWEDTFVKTGQALPITINHYKDIAGNNYAHMIAYACVNRAAYAQIDLNIVNYIFKTIYFSENICFQSVNDLNETPLQILSYITEFSTLVETLLLRIEPKNRFNSLHIMYWSDTWKKLNTDTFVNNMVTVVETCQKMKGFLIYYVTLAKSFPGVFRRLFDAGYTFNPEHLLFKNEKFEQIIHKNILEHPSWKNITSWLSYLDNKDFHIIKPLLEKRADLIKRALLFVSFPEIIYEPL